MRTTAISALRKLAARTANLTGWRRYGLAFVLGALITLSLPPLGLFPVLLLGFPPLVWLMQGAVTRRRAFFTCWAFAWGYFIFGLYWIGFALLVDADTFGWLLPFATVALPAVLAVYYGLAGLLWRKSGWGGIGGVLAFALLIFLAEVARGTLFTGFPWNLFGYAWTEFPAMLQSVSLFGIYGLTLLTLVAACLPAVLGDDAVHPRHALAATLLSLLLLSALGLWGAERLANAQDTFVPHVRVRLVQPNIPQSLKWDTEQRARNLQILLDLSSSPAERPITHIIWPETALAYFIDENASLRQTIGASLPEQTTLITGVVRRTLSEENGQDRYYNALMAMSHGGDILATYDKAHLVPFGEYVPFRSFAPVARMADGTGDFVAGTGPRTLDGTGLPPFSPLICYEVLFPRAVVDPERRPGLIVNVTNDAWYGHTAGPHQHLAIAATRAVEEGIPLIRVANTGISATIDPYGRLTAYLELGRRGVIDADIPAPLTKATPFSRWGHLLVLALGLLLAVLAWSMKVKNVFYPRRLPVRDL